MIDKIVEAIFATLDKIAEWLSGEGSYKILGG